MTISNRSLHFALLLPALVPLWGCTGGANLPTVPVSGTVTYNGQPLGGATVSFHPKEYAEGARGASGVTDGEGKFKLQTLVAGNKLVAGALPGDYAVTVSKLEDMTERYRAARAGGGAVAAEADAPRPSPPPGRPTGGPPGRPTGGPPGRPGGGSPVGGPPEGGGPPPGNMTGMVAKSLIPEKYKEAASSGFTATVKPSGNEPFKFELAD